jgi:hypothetical protein
MKKSIKAIALAVVLAAMPVVAFADDPSPGTGNANYSNVITVGANSNAFSTPGAITQIDVVSNGENLTVIGQTNNDGVTSGFVDTGSGARRATDEEAAQNLPHDAKSAIDAADRGDLSGIQQGGIDTNGKSAYGNSVPISTEAPNQKVTIYVSNLPDKGTIQVAFFNKDSKKWELIEVSIDRAKKTVTFTAPYSGTAVVIGDNSKTVE